jgi:hypothetical protein
MTGRATLTIQRRLTGMAYALGALLCALSAFPASAIEQIGFQSVVNFDEFAPGTTTITYGPNDFTITGGVVQAGSADFPAHSSANVYYSSTGQIGTTSSDGYGLYETDGWPFIGAYVTPSTEPVTATFTGFPEYPSPPYLPATVATLGSAANQLLEFTDPQINVFAVSFSSAAPFAIDDLTYGLPDVMFGIPEPSTWAMMLVGFAGLGYAGYRRARAGHAAVAA